MDIEFSIHAEKRIRKRNLTKEEIINVISYPDKTIKVKGKYCAQKNIGRGRIEVVYEKEKIIKVITVYWI